MLFPAARRKDLAFPDIAPRQFLVLAKGARRQMPRLNLTDSEIKLINSHKEVTVSARLIVKAFLLMALCLSFALILSESASAQGSGYTYCAREGQRCNFGGTKDVAYGANGQFYYRYMVSGGIDCNNNVFGDPIYGVTKACYIKNSLDLGPSGSDAPSAQLTASTRNNLRRVLTTENFNTFMQLVGNVVNAENCGKDVVRAFDVTYPVATPYGVIEFPADWPPETAEDCYDTAGQMMDFFWNKLVPPVE